MKIQRLFMGTALDARARVALPRDIGFSGSVPNPSNRNVKLVFFNSLSTILFFLVGLGGRFMCLRRETFNFLGVRVLVGV